MRTMLKLISTLWIALAILSTVNLASASGYNVNLDEYQQNPNTINIMKASFGDGNFYIANFNYDAKPVADGMQYYQAICIYNPKFDSLSPLNAKRITQQQQTLKEELVNRNHSLMLWATPVISANLSKKSTLYSPFKDYRVSCTGFTQLTQAGQIFKDVAIIEISNPQTGEKMLQYLAKGHGVIKISAVKADGTIIDIASLHKIKALNPQDVSDFIGKYFR